MSDRNEINVARLAHATILIRDLEVMITRIGGHSTPSEQATVNEARAFLVDMGLREPAVVHEWTNRECACTFGSNGGRLSYGSKIDGVFTLCKLHKRCNCTALADGTNATPTRCELHPVRRP